VSPEKREEAKATIASIAAATAQAHDEPDEGDGSTSHGDNASDFQGSASAVHSSESSVAADSEVISTTETPNVAADALATGPTSWIAEDLADLASAQEAKPAATHESDQPALLPHIVFSGPELVGVEDTGVMVFREVVDGGDIVDEDSVAEGDNIEV
jgi:hypothetical protein